MAHHYEAVPVAFSIALAAKLAGVSRQTFRRLYLDSGLCAVTGLMEDVAGIGAGKVWRWDLESALGRRISVEQVQEADKQLDKGREWQRRYRRQKGNQ